MPEFPSLMPSSCYSRHLHLFDQLHSQQELLRLALVLEEEVEAEEVAEEEEEVVAEVAEP